MGLCIRYVSCETDSSTRQKVIHTATYREEPEIYNTSPIAKQAEQVIGVGTQSYFDNPSRLAENHIELFYQDGLDVPLVKSCAAWLICLLIPEEYNQQNYDLLIGKVVGAWADDHIYENGHWQFDEISDEIKTLHYIAGNQFYITGKGVVVKY